MKTFCYYVITVIMKYFPLQNSFLEDLGFNPLPPGVAYLYPLITSENLSPETFNVF